MEQFTDLADKLTDTTKYLFHSFYAGNTEPWFSLLDKSAVYLGSADPMLIGKTAIENHFKKYEGIQTEILEEEYHATLQSKTVGFVYGHFVFGTSQKNEFAFMRFTLIYKIHKDGLSIIHQHNSYEFKNNSLQPEHETQNKVDNLAFQFIRDILSDKDNDTQFCISSGSNTVFLNANMVLYVQSVGKHTEFVCVDRTVSCNTPISELRERLPNMFYQIHRCYIVNIKHIHEIKRFSVEMISGEKLPVPAAAYTQVKNDLIAYLNK